MYATMRELEERQLLPLIKLAKEDSANQTDSKSEFVNPLDLLDQDKLMEDLERKRSLFQGRIHDKNNEVKSIDHVYERLRRQIYELSEQNIHRMITELETGGNIRFEEGKPTDKWFSSCEDLIKSRFDPELMKAKYGYENIQIIRVTRIHNRFLRNRFEEKIEMFLEQSGAPQNKKAIEYLFYGVEPKLPNEMFRVIEEGFRLPSEYKRMGLPPHIILVNSILSADSARLQSYWSSKHHSVSNNKNDDRLLSWKYDAIPFGHILICKVFYAGSQYITIESK